jgi:hypothetical protein
MARRLAEKDSLHTQNKTDHVFGSGMACPAALNCLVWRSSGKEDQTEETGANVVSLAA